METVELQECVLNFSDELPTEIWEKVITVYERMSGWLGFGNGEQGDENIPYWFSYNSNEKSISASFEMHGLQISGFNLTETEWNEWIITIKKLSTEILGFKVGERELGEVGYEIEWINPPTSMKKEKTVIFKSKRAELKKPWWKFWLRDRS